jgi:hypothetical protein
MGHADVQVRQVSVRGGALCSFNDWLWCRVAAVMLYVGATLGTLTYKLCIEQHRPAEPIPTSAHGLLLTP